MTEHATKQIKEFNRRFDGKKYIIKEDQCAEHRNTKVHGYMPVITTDEEWRINEVEDENLQTSDFQLSPNAIFEPNAYLNQMIRSEDTEKVRDIHCLDNKNAAHTLTFTYRSGKCKDETQVT